MPHHWVKFTIPAAMSRMLRIVRVIRLEEQKRSYCILESASKVFSSCCILIV